MGKILIVIAIMLSLFLTASADAWTLNWDTQTGVDGFTLYYNTVENGETSEIDVGDVNSYDLDSLGLIKGTRYEFWLTAYNATGHSAESDHLRWTYPKDPIIIETMGAPVNILIRP